MRIILIILWMAGDAYSLAPVELGQDRINELAFDFELFEEKSNSLSISEVTDKGQAFMPSLPGPLNIRYSKSAYWGRFDVDNRSGVAKTLYMVSSVGYVDRLEVFAPDGLGGFEQSLTGDDIPVNNQTIRERQAVVSFTASPGVNRYYFKVVNKGEGNPRLGLMDERSHLVRSQTDTNLTSLILGIFAVMIAYNTMLLISFRTRSYIFYVSYLLCWFFSLVISNQYAALYIFPSGVGGLLADVAVRVCGLGIMVFSCLFARSFLALHLYDSKASKLLLLLVGFFCVAVPIGVFLDQHIIYQAVYQIVAIPAMLYSGYVTLRKGYRPAWFFVVGWAFLMIGTLVSNAMLLEVLPYNYYLSFSTEYGAVVVCVLFALGLGDKMHLKQVEAKKEIEILNEELQVKIAEIKEKEKARTIFFNNTSHELRTPLNGIIGYLEMLERGRRFKVSDELKVVLSKVLRLTHGLKDLVDNILEIARSRKGDLKVTPEKIQVGVIVEDVSLLSEGLRTDDQSVEFNIETSWPEGSDLEFKTDFKLVRTILRNLIGNAYKFRQAGKVCQITVSFALIDREMQIKVTDTGIGIEEKNLELIFNEFKQVDDGSTRAFEGSGLGLNLVRKIVAAMGGKISVNSVFGQGSSFTVTLPEVDSAKSVSVAELAINTEAVRERLEDEQKSTVKKEVSREGRGEHILVVDDNIANVETVAMLMTDFNYEVSTALNGPDALKILQNGEIDLVLLDLMMPGMSGEEVLERIRTTREGQALPVIFLTARASEEDRLAGLRASADDYLGKPIDSDLLLEKVRNILDRVHKADELGKISQLKKLEKMVEDRTNEVVAGKKKIQKILDHIEQGILTVDKSLTIDSEFSAFLASFYNVDPAVVPGQDIMEFIFPNSGLSADEYNQAAETLKCVVGETSLAWDFNSEHLPLETTVVVDGEEKVIALKWTPIVNEEEVTEGLMLAMQNLTAQRQLEAQVAEQKAANEKMMTIISEMVAHKRSSLTKYFDDAADMVKNILADLDGNFDPNKVFRDLHTVKGGARLLKAKSLMNVAHLAEEPFQKIQKGENVGKGVLIEKVRSLQEEMQDYLHVLNDVLGRGRSATDVIENETLPGIFGAQLTSLLEIISEHGCTLRSVKCRDRVVHWKKTVLGDLRDMLMHALNNAVDHGYLRPKELGAKIDVVDIEVLAFSADESIIIEIKDQGVGFDFGKIRKLAMEKGILFGQDDDSILNTLFMDGVSTAETVTESSGRGVGLPAIKVIAANLGGEVSLSKNEPCGAKLTIQLPLVVAMEPPITAGLEPDPPKLYG